MDELTKKLKTRIAELKAQRNQLTAELQRQAQALIDPFNFAIAELERLLPNEQEAVTGEPEKADLPASPEQSSGWNGK